MVKKWKGVELSRGHANDGMRVDFPFSLDL